jgi:hypothetical protein
MTTTRHRTTTLTDQAAQTLSGSTEPATPSTPLGGRPRPAQRTSGGVAYANAENLASLAGFLQRLTAATAETGWHAPNMIVSFGDAEDESIVVGVRWITDTYVAEIR